MMNLDLYNGKAKVGHVGLCMVKVENVHFFFDYCAILCINAFQSNHYEILEVKVILITSQLAVKIFKRVSTPKLLS